MPGPLQRNGHISLRAGSPVVSGKCSGASWQSGEKNGAKREGKRRSAVGQEKQRDFIIERANNILSFPTALFALQQGAYVPCDSFSVKGPFTPLRCAAVLSETHNPSVTLYPRQNATHVDFMLSVNVNKFLRPLL